MKSQEKRGISPVIAVILLVLITFMAISIIWAFIKPMVETSLEEGGSCFQLRDYAEIVDSEYTCYNEVGKNTSIMIKRGFDDIEIKGFRVSIFSEGESKVYSVVINTTDNIKMWQAGNFVTSIELPEPGESKTYLFENLIGTRAELAVITKTGKTCKMGSYDIPECSK